MVSGPLIVEDPLEHITSDVIAPVSAYHSVDLALSRDFHLQNRVRLTFRAEGTNIFNMVSLGQPGNAVPAAGTTSATFGVIRTANPMRKMQFGLRLTF